MEINIKGKSIKLAWEYLVAPGLFLLLVLVLVLSNFSSIRRFWVSFSNDKAVIINTNEQNRSIPVKDIETLNEDIDDSAPSDSLSPAEPVIDKPAESLSDKDAIININKATIEELMSLPYIGEVKAKAIIDYRNKNGPFKSVDELDNIKGIGAKTLEKLRLLVTV